MCMSSECLVVCLPRFILSLIAPVWASASGLIALRVDDLPAVGNNRSHANNATKRRFLPNLHSHRFWVESEKRFVSLRVSAKGMRIIDKRGVEVVLAELRASGVKV